MTSEVTPVSENVKAEAAELQAKAEELTVSAKDVAASGSASGEEVAEDTLSRVKRYADRVVETANKSADSAKDYVSKVVTKVQKYAESTQASGSTTSTTLQDTLSKAITVPSSTGASTGSEGTDEESVKFPLSVVTWCSSICGSKVEATSQTSTVSLEGAKDQISKGLTDAALQLEEVKSAGAKKVQAAAEAVNEEAASATLT